MWQIKSILDAMFDLLMWPFVTIDPIWSLLFLSLLTGIIILVVFRYTSDQKGIEETKDKIKAHLLEIRIFKDSLKIQLSAQKRLFLYNMIYMKHAIKPLLFMILPIGFVIIQMDAWYGHKPLQPGESTILSVRVSGEGAKELLSNIYLEVDKGLNIETPLLRIPEGGELDWRIRANESGVHQVKVEASGLSFLKEVVVAEGELRRISSHSVDAGRLSSLFKPGTESIPNNSFIQEIEVHYPDRSIEMLGLHAHWLVVFFILTTVVAFASKGFFKVEI